ncbi:MAG: DUF5320 domain-containing protein [Candidatus Aenigmatarchaeota archaeon]|nr:DUF5320 domain-containing protein [Candidatus Aenigmarchaeota archaeon]
MPWGDGTGPWWIQGRAWRCLELRRRFYFSGPTPITLTKEEQIKILEEELKQIEVEKQEIQKKLEELKKS